ncbi:MAG TPA: rubredoxin [Candidatus Margulisbacteria bacterium]|nr:MAG: rubredoxin [Candidatus Margulisbacteria bacterium GWE2_39_32]HCT84774.1 rubredoxin [Candidatus Margulisiibacteriota bacterium]
MKWKCSICGYLHSGDDAPEACPKCGAAKEKIGKLEQAQSDLVERAGFTNQLHMDLVNMLENVVELAEDGIEDNLDPGCVSIFMKAKDQALILKQSIKAELAAHVSKGKWG